MTAVFLTWTNLWLQLGELWLDCICPVRISLTPFGDFTALVAIFGFSVFNTNLAQTLSDPLCCLLVKCGISCIFCLFIRQGQAVKLALFHFGHFDLLMKDIFAVSSLYGIAVVVLRNERSRCLYVQN